MTKQLKKREFCLWLVPPSQARVHKMRVSTPRLVLVGFFALAVTGSVVFMAGDYARVQLLQAKNYYFLNQISSERDTLRASYSELQTQVVELTSAKNRALSYEKDLRRKFMELSSVIDAASSLGFIEGKKGRAAGSKKAPPKALASDKKRVDPPVALSSVKKGFPSLGDELNSKYTSESGVGGSESDCDSDDSLCEVALIDSTRASLSPVALDLATQQEMTQLLDQYIRALRRMPLGRPVSESINSPFGWRWSPFENRIRRHEGLDFEARTGSKVRASGDGRIKAVRYTPTYGLVIDVEHNHRVISRYAHLSKAMVKPGDKIVRGALIALSGSTGRSTGPHLHYEIIVDGRQQNPARFLDMATAAADFLRRRA